MHAARRSRLVSAIACCLFALAFAFFLPSALADSTSSNAYAQLVQGDSPLAYWRLNGGESSSIIDATGNGHALQWVDPIGYDRTPLLGAQAIPALQPDTAVQFDGSTNDAPYGKVVNDGSLNPETFSVEAWVKPIGNLPPSHSDGNTREAIISSYSGCEPPSDSSNCELRGYQLYISNYFNWGDHPQFAFSTGDEIATGLSNKNWVVDTQTTVKKDTWYHVVATATPRSNGNAEMHLYVNGKNVANCPEDGTGTCPRSDTFDPSNSDKPTFLGLGTREDVKTYRLNGEMDEVAVYDHLLTADRVLAHYNAGTAVQPTITLQNANGSSFHTGRTARFSVSVGNVSGTIQAQLKATVTGPNHRSIDVPINGTTGDGVFSYPGKKAGTDTVTVSGTVEGMGVAPKSVKVHWLAGANSIEGSLGVTGSSLVARSARAIIADPIDSNTGNFYQSVTDVSITGTGIPFSIARTYNSLDENTGAMGRSWSGSLFSSLFVDDAGNVTLNTGDGQQIGYILEPDGSYQADKNVTATLAKTSSGYDLVQKDQDVRHFDSDGRIVSWLDTNGQGLHFSYDGNGLLTSVTDSAGREYDLAYNASGHLSGVSLADGTSLAYGYDGDLLTTVTDRAGAVTHYAYDPNGFLESATDGSGKLLFSNGYDDQGRITSQADAYGNTSTFDWSGETVIAKNALGYTSRSAYNDSGQLSSQTNALGNESSYVYDDANDLISDTDKLGNKATYTYDERGNTLSKTDPLGNTESWTYDQDNNILANTDQLDHTTSYTYDSNGNVLTETDPLENTTSYEYDSAGRQISKTDPLHRMTRSVYDGEGNLIESIMPSGAKTTYTYDSNGNVLTETDPLGNTTSYEYDSAGRLVKTTDPLGHSTTSTYDEAGRLLSQTDANGNTTQYVYDANGRQIKVIKPDGSTLQTTYDAVDNPTPTTDALGNVTLSDFDAVGNEIAQTSPTGKRTTTTYDANGNEVASTDSLDHVTHTTYDAAGRAIEVKDPLGRIMKTVYDPNGNVIKQVDPLDHVSKTDYDANGNVVKKTDPLGNSTTSSYDKAGQLLSETDANGGTTHYAYDPDGNEISTTSPSGAVTTSTYDAAGDLISKTDPLGHTTTYAYDKAGNEISKTDPLGHTTHFAYDPNGNRVSKTDPLGHVTKTVFGSMDRKTEQVDALGRITKTSYDQNGNVVKETDPLGNATTSSYDKDGNLTRVTDPLGNSKTSDYDKAGRLISETDANGHTTHYAYDAAGEKTKVTAFGGVETSFAYDLAGRLIARTDANAYTTSYAYDAAGRRVSKTNPLDRTWRYTYDGNGNLTRTTTPSGGTISQSYDVENRPTGKTYSDGTPSVYYSYDQAGNKTEVKDGTGTTRYAYDAADQRVSALTPKGSFLYGYDAAGNLTSRTYPNGLKTVYSYNDADEMVTAKVGKDITYYNHDPNGNLASTLHPNGVLDTRSYDAAGRISDISSTDPKGKPFYSRSYTYDPVGNPLTLIATTPREHSKGWWGSVWRHDGVELARWTETYSYDARDRLVKACMSSSCHHYYAYSYDAVGNRTALETKKATTTYAYDAADELLSRSKLKLHHHHPDVTIYAYDLNGNQTRSGDRHFAYNLENKLVKVMDKHGHDKVSYTYSEDGLMATRSEGPEITAYSWDTLGELPELAIESASKKSLWHFEIKDSRSYTYGEGPIGIEAGRDSITFHTDSLGSVVQLSDERGRLLQSYRYSPFGGDYSPHSSQSAKADDLNPIRFTGQYLDSETDLYNMRAREYDPETGRFLEVDPLACDQACSSTYAYVDDRPTILVDPTGENPANPDPPVTHYPKKIRVTVFSNGQLKANLKRGKGATWRWEKVNSKNWHICYHDGKSRGATGPNWVYDESGSTSDQGRDYLDSVNIYSCWLSSALGGLSHGKPLGRGYVYMSPIQGKPYGWKRHNYFDVPVTRYYAELYGWGVWNPNQQGYNFLSHWKYSIGSPVVGFSDQPDKNSARKRVHDVCSSSKFPSPGWMGIYADAIGPGKETISSDTLSGIAKGLDRCSRGL